MRTLHIRILCTDESQAERIREDVNNMFLCQEGGVLTASIADTTLEEEDIAREREIIQ